MIRTSIDFLKLASNYSYSNDCSPFHQFYSDLKILQNGPLLIKGSTINKRVVPEKLYSYIAFVV